MSTPSRRQGPFAWQNGWLDHRGQRCPAAEALSVTSDPRTWPKHTGSRLAKLGSSQGTPETGNRRARDAIGAPAEPAGRGICCSPRLGLRILELSAAGTGAVSCSLKRISRAAPCTSRILRSKSPRFLQKPVILSSRRSRVLSPVLKGLLPVSGVPWLDPSMRRHRSASGGGRPRRGRRCRRARRFPARGLRCSDRDARCSRCRGAG